MNIKKFDKIEYTTSDIRSTILGGINYFLLCRKIKAKEAYDFYHFYLEVEGNNEEFLLTNIQAIVILYEELSDKEIISKLENTILYIRPIGY